MSEDADGIREEGSMEGVQAVRDGEPVFVGDGAFVLKPLDPEALARGVIPTRQILGRGVRGDGFLNDSRFGVCNAESGDLAD